MLISSSHVSKSPVLTEIPDFRSLQITRLNALNTSQLTSG